MKICFISSLIFDSRGSNDKVGDFKPFGQYDFYLFTNLKDFTSTSWKVVYLEDSMLDILTNIFNHDYSDTKTCMENNIYKSRYIKFMGWHYLKNVMKKHYDVIFYCDAIYSPNINKNWEEAALRIKENESGLMQKLHPLKTDPYSESFLCTRARKHNKQNHEKMIQYLKQVGAKETHIYENTTFGYDPNNEKITQAYSDFWNIYSTKRLTYRDQPLWGWICQKHNIKAVPVPNIHTNVVHKITPPNDHFFFNFTGKNFNSSRNYNHVM